MIKYIQPNSSVQIAWLQRQIQQSLESALRLLGSLPVKHGTHLQINIPPQTVGHLISATIKGKKLDSVLLKTYDKPSRSLVKTGQLAHTYVRFNLIAIAATHKIQLLSVSQQDTIPAELVEVAFNFSFFSAILANNLAQDLESNKAGQMMAVPLSMMQGTQNIMHIPLLQAKERINSLMSLATQQSAYAEAFAQNCNLDEPTLEFFSRATLELQTSLRHFRIESYLYPEQLAGWVAKKNERNFELGLSRQHAVIWNPNAYQSLEVDQTAFASLVELLREVYEGQRPRTQVTFFLYQANGSISHAFDVSSKEGRLQIIHVDPANNIQQHAILIMLEGALSRCMIPHQICACAANLYDGFRHNDLYGYAMASHLANFSFEQIESAATLEQPAFKNRLTNKPEQEAALASVKWFDLTILGTKAIMMSRNEADIKQNLEKLYPGKSNQHFKTLCQWHGLDFQAQEPITYIEKRRETLLARMSDNIFNHVTESQIRQQLGLKPQEGWGKAFRMLGAGQGPRVFLDFLLSKVPEKINEAGPLTGKTALHNAFAKGQKPRAALLLSRGADASLKDLANKKPSELVPEKDSIEDLCLKFSSLRT